ncbi:MAG: metallophosphoesterase [Lentisphaeria bacterium]|nr:metallophosphoesterase [Lentisphaeria bacterium]
MKLKLLLCCFIIVAGCILHGAEIEKNSFRVAFDKNFKPEDAKKVSETGILPGKVQTFRFPDTMVFDLRTLFKTAKSRKDSAILNFKIISDSDCQRAVGLSADYWYTCYINGKFVGTTEPVGEDNFLINPYNRGYKISLKKGVNQVAIHTSPGNASWKIACCLYPDSTGWPVKQEDRNNVFKALFPVPEKIIGPEVIKVSSDSAVIIYYRETKDAVSVAYWKKDEKQKKKTISETPVYGRIPQKNLFRFELKNLVPDSEYCYELHSITPGRRAVSGSFRTAPAKNSNHTLVAISDTQAYYDNRVAAIRKMVRQGTFSGADLLVSLGDVADGLDDFERVYFETFLTPFRQAGVKVPFYPVRGNHEYRGIDTDRYSDWFGCPYYAFRYGDVFYFVVDTGEDKPRQKVGHTYTLWTDTEVYFKSQREWLRRVIKTEACRSAKYRIVLAHAVPFEWEKPYYSEQIAKFADCFYGKNPECRIDLWLCGDIHSPYRFDPVTKELVGAKRKFSKKRTGALTAKDLRDIHFPIYVNDGPNGAGQRFSATRIEVQKDSLLVTCTGEDGTVMDKIRIRKGKPFEILKTTYEKYIPYGSSK